MEKSKMVAGLLALFGGSFGLHKFYLGDPGSGIFYIILALMTKGFFPVATLLGVVDAIRLFTMSTAAFDAKHNKAKRKITRQPSGARSRTNRQNEVIRERDRHNNRQLTSKQRNNPFRKSADKKFEEYDLEGALDDYAKATEITPADMKMHFNLACIHSLKENTAESLHHLEKAFDLGFKDVEKIKTVDELAYLRIQPDFDAFVSNGYKNPRSKTVAPPKDDLLQNDALLAQLNKLKEMRERGLLSEKEFMYEKDRLRRR